MKTILVVDDNDVDRKIISRIVEKMGIRAVTAINGQEGLQKALQEAPDMIILDCEMPVMNGQEMCKRLQDDHKTENIPVLFLTSINTPKNIIDCFEVDAANFLSKPVNSKILSNQIAIILEENSTK
jgi:CheY-like chemotaxis protein